MHVQTDNGRTREAKSSVVAVRPTIRPDVAVGLDFPHHVIPDVRTGHAAPIELLRELAVHLVPRPADAGAQIPLQRVDQVGEFLRIPAVLTAAADRQPHRLVVVGVWIVAADWASGCFLALLGVTASWTLGHNLGHVATHA